MSRLPARRLLLVHAHPDDESITNGVTMARYVSEGAHVTLVTCTLGDEGEVIPPELAHLAAGRTPQHPAAASGRSGPAGASGDRPPTPLGAHRKDELAAAMAALGVTDHRFLGGPGHYRDSGMMNAEANDCPDCFWRADTDVAAALLVPVIREIRPQVMVTYDPTGGYGHPDHIRTHRVAMRAAELAADPGHRPASGAAHRIARILWNCVARSTLEQGLAELRAAGSGGPFPAVATADDVPGVVDDAQIAVVIEASPAEAAAKAAAMRAHATQIAVRGTFFALSNNLGQPILTTEHYRLPDGPPAGAPLRDLFAGVGPAEAEPAEVKTAEAEATRVRAARAESGGES